MFENEKGSATFVYLDNRFRRDQNCSRIWQVCKNVDVTTVRRLYWRVPVKLIENRNTHDNLMPYKYNFLLGISILFTLYKYAWGVCRLGHNATPIWETSTAQS